MTKFKCHATYVHDFHRFGVRYLGEISRHDAADSVEGCEFPGMFG